MKTKIVILLFSVSFCMCTNKTSDYIILTCGRSEDPSSQRFGIHLTNNKLFYCKEKFEIRGAYDFFECDINSAVFQDYKQLIVNNFFDVNRNGFVVDATPYQLIYSFDSVSDTILFYTMNLTKEQNSVLKNLIEFPKGRAMCRISFHRFPDSLLLSCPKRFIPRRPPVESDIKP